VVSYHRIKKESQGLKNTYSVPIRLRGLATAKVAQSPSSVTKHAELAAVSQQAEQRLESSAAKDIVTAVGAVTSDVTKGPDGLLSHIGLGAGKELDEDGDSASLNDDLGLGGGTRGNVGQGPSSLELHQGVRGSQELDEAADDTGLDDLLDGRVPLLGQKLSELGGGLDLEVDLVGEDARNHLRKILVQLFGIMLAVPRQ
jgi:hypothetical protein